MSPSALPTVAQLALEQAIQHAAEAYRRAEAASNKSSGDAWGKFMHGIDAINKMGTVDAYRQGLIKAWEIATGLVWDKDERVLYEQVTTGDD